MSDRDRDLRPPQDSHDFRDVHGAAERYTSRDIDRDVRRRGPAQLDEPRRDRPGLLSWVPDQNPTQGFGGIREHSTHPRGRFYGRGPKGYRRSDERILEELSDRLMTHPDIDASDIEVRVANGIVTLTGTVEDRHEKHIAEYLAEDSVGVDDVNNQLKVRHGFWASLTGEKATERQIERHADLAADTSAISPRSSR